MRVVRSLTRLTTHAPQNSHASKKQASGLVPSTDDARRYHPPAPQRVPHERNRAESALHGLAQVRRDARCRDGTV